MIDELDRYTERLREETPLLAINRTDTIRYLLARGPEGVRGACEAAKAALSCSTSQNEQQPSAVGTALENLLSNRLWSPASVSLPDWINGGSSLGALYSLY
jgi:hypothetical protein